MSVVVFYIDSSGTPRHLKYEDGDFSAALRMCEVLRKDHRYSHVTISTELKNSVGKPGVVDVEPDYNWKKRRL